MAATDPNDCAYLKELQDKVKTTGAAFVLALENFQRRYSFDPNAYKKYQDARDAYDAATSELVSWTKEHPNCVKNGSSSSSNSSAMTTSIDCPVMKTKLANLDAEIDKVIRDRDTFVDFVKLHALMSERQLVSKLVDGACRSPIEGKD